jgi:AAA+ ATPase superfamily predicted ATPase
MFINRENELRILNNEYIDSKFSFTVIYGRRRVGKTTLIKEYIKDKPSIYFLTTLESLTTLIKRFQTIISIYLKTEF